MSSKQNSRINLLTSEVINYIAAGEVIARPLSIIKELLENSIDAGSKHIKVYVKNGGLDEICVIDDGCGIEKEDLHLALQQHATSKIKQIKDLDSINSLGFRGEALASIAAVSKVKIFSKTVHSDHGFSCNNQDMVIEPVAHKNGTTIIVNDLFYNTPVRKKFLRSANTEWQHIEDMFVSIALSNFFIAFELYREGKLCKKIMPANSLTEKEKRLGILCGKGMQSNAQFITMEQNGLFLEGWILASDSTIDCGKHQYFFVNNRYVRDRVINHAIRQAYSLYPNCIIGYCLYLTIEPSLVDINVHPTKLEIRFREQRIIYAFLDKTIRNALEVFTKHTLLPKDISMISAEEGKNHRHDLEDLVTYRQFDNNSIEKKITIYHDVVTNIDNSSKTSPEVKLYTVIDGALLIAEVEEKIMLVNIKKAMTLLLYLQLEQELLRGVLTSVNIKITHNFHNKHNIVIDLQPMLLSLGFSVMEVGLNLVAIQSVPKVLVNCENYIEIIEDILVAKDKLLIIAMHAAKSMEVSDSFLQEMCLNILNCKDQKILSTYRIIIKERVLELID